MDRQRTIGIALVALGALFLLARFSDLGAFLWPLFVIAPGAALLVWAFVGGKDAAGLAVPGSIVSTVGLILLIQTLTGRFDTWAYAWGLIVASVGVGTWLYGTLADKEKEVREGWRTATTGLVLFAAFGVFFEFVIGLGGGRGWLGSWVVPLLLIGAGVFLLWRRRAPNP
jgi:hypothetical protein